MPSSPRDRSTGGGDLDVVTVPLSKLKLDPKNARLHGPVNIDAIVASLDRFGQRKPIVVSKNMTVVAGNGTVEAARALEWETLAVTVFPGTPAEARAYAIADNHTSDLSTWDNVQLVETLQSLNDVQLAATGFTPPDIAGLLASITEQAAVDAIAEEDESSGIPPEVDPATLPYPPETVVETAAAHYRSVGFPYPEQPAHVSMQQINRLAVMPTENLRQSSIAYHVPDVYHPERFTTAVPGKNSALTQFSRDDRLRLAIAFVVDNGGALSDLTLLGALGFIRNAQTAAQFRPAFALWYLRRFAADGGRWLDTSAGWGGRLVGYAASHMSEYIGIDPSTRAVENNQRMIDELTIDGARLICKPAEDVTVKEVGGANSIDIALTSPPYFAKEQYADEDTQSYVRFPTGDEWRKGFLAKMLALQFRALKPGAMSIVNIADVKIKSEIYPLVDWTVAEGINVGFEHVGNETFPMARVPGRGERPEQSEPCILLRKPM